MPAIIRRGSRIFVMMLISCTENSPPSAPKRIPKMRDGGIETLPIQRERMLATARRIKKMEKIRA